MNKPYTFKIKTWQLEAYLINTREYWMHKTLIGIHRQWRHPTHNTRHSTHAVKRENSCPWTNIKIMTTKWKLYWWSTYLKWLLYSHLSDTRDQCYFVSANRWKDINNKGMNSETYQDFCTNIPICICNRK